jgi:AcrR family transcriptional regulator
MARARPARPRRTQEERSASTQRRLLDAAIDCLYELGYARTTTVEIAARAGVSRGAQLHHFPTKAELVTRAVEYVFARRNDEFRVAFAKIPRRADRAAAAVDRLWSILSGPTYYAWLELVVAARTDPALRKQVNEIAARFSLEFEQTFRQIFPPPRDPSPLYELTPAFAFTFMQGLAVDKIAISPPRLQARLLAAMKQLSVLTIPKGEGP